VANSHVLPWLRSAECASEEGLGGRQVAIDVAAVEPWRRQDRLRFVAEHQSGPTFKVFGEQQWHHPFRVGLGGQHEQADCGLDQFVREVSVAQEVASDAGLDQVGPVTKAVLLPPPTCKAAVNSARNGAACSMQSCWTGTVGSSFRHP
jgi:hypothetical protein